MTLLATSRDRPPDVHGPRPGLVMKRQTGGLCLLMSLLSLLFAWCVLAPHNVHAVTPQPAVTATTR